MNRTIVQQDECSVGQISFNNSVLGNESREESQEGRIIVILIKHPSEGPSFRVQAADDWARSFAALGFYPVGPSLRKPSLSEACISVKDGLIYVQNEVMIREEAEKQLWALILLHRNALFVRPKVYKLALLVTHIQLSSKQASQVG